MTIQCDSAHDCTMTDQRWVRLGEMLLNRRVKLGGVNREKFVRDAGLGYSRGIFDIENAKRDNYSPATKALIEQTYRWAPGSITTVLAGGQPTELDDLDDQSELIGLVVAQWYRAAPIAKRRQARDMVTQFIERNPHGGNSGD